MLKIVVPASEQYDEVNNLFIETKEQTLLMEHSLLSISKWEEKWKKPFLSKEPKTEEESIDYLKCMTITQNVDPAVYLAIDAGLMKQISDYMEDSHTATTFSNLGPPSREIMTAEVIYYAMFANGIDKECEKWHLNKLLTLIKVFGEKTKEPKKMSRNQIMSRNRALNAARRKRLNTRG
jgi:hypothetical protein